jgi:hypothetical protein
MRVITIAQWPPCPGRPRYLDSATASLWDQMQASAYWLTSADRFLLDIAATFMARYRRGELKHGDVALLINVTGKLGFSPKERRSMNLPEATP